jgi:hypothetical protein
MLSDWKHDGHAGAFTVRCYLECASELANPFLHAAHTDASLGRREIPLLFWRNSFALVRDFYFHVGFRRKGDSKPDWKVNPMRQDGSFASGNRSQREEDCGEPYERSRERGFSGYLEPSSKVLPNKFCTSSRLRETMEVTFCLSRRGSSPSTVADMMSSPPSVK